MTKCPTKIKLGNIVEKFPELTLKTFLMYTYIDIDYNNILHYNGEIERVEA